MASPRLNRRTVLRGSGGVAVALPWLEAMRNEHPARAGGPASRFVAVFQPGGTVRDKWLPRGGETAFTLGPILAPLEALRKQILIVDGLEMKSAVGEQHQAGIIAWLTGTPQSGRNRNYAGGPSIDQVIATRISAGKKPKASIQMAIRWATGKSHGLLSPINAANYEDNATFNPIPPQLDPVEIWNGLFGAGSPAGGTAAAARLARRRSILDYLDHSYAALSRRLGAADRQKIDQHLTKIREIEQGLAVAASKPAVCKGPPLVDTSDYNPRSGVNSADDGTIRDSSTDAAIPKVGKLMMDMLIMALACDLTAVATLQWSDTEAKHTFPWLDLQEHHHFYQHDGGFRPVECAQIATWYSQQHVYLLDQMSRVDMGGHSLLDESVVFFGSELQEPPSHSKTDMPFLLAGNGGGLRTGRWVTFPGRPHNNLLVSILNLFGDPRQTFGDPGYCSGPLANLA